MKDYKFYENLAKEEIIRIHGLGTVEHVQHLDKDLAIITQSMIMLSLVDSISTSASKSIVDNPVKEAIKENSKSAKGGK
ncbi:MAG: hypothetical protein ACRCZ0_11520 [Cetobacterium sp.]